MNDREEKYEGHEEGEYQFSDEHTAYEVDTETTKMADVAVVKDSSLSGISKYKRLFIVLAVVFGVMFFIYRILGTNSNAPTEITQATPTTPAPTAVATKPVVAKPTVTAPVTTAAVAPAPAVTTTLPAEPAPSTTIPTNVPVDQTVNVASQTPVISAPPTSPPGMVQYESSGKELVDRVATLEQQNAKMVNLMQIEYAQKLADAQSQSVATQAKLKDLSNKVSSMESALNQIVQILQGSGKRVSITSGSLPATKSMAPKQTYSVQAIIPGRAWLKSDAGDTVTVAEGDLLRDYGRVTKIDPYDGIVSIDTGNKVISLSYGSSGE